jgi:hypothetical protein
MTSRDKLIDESFYLSTDGVYTAYTNYQNQFRHRTDFHLCFIGTGYECQQKASDIKWENKQFPVQTEKVLMEQYLNRAV